MAERAFVREGESTQQKDHFLLYSYIESYEIITFFWHFENKMMMLKENIPPKLKTVQLAI